MRSRYPWHQSAALHRAERGLRACDRPRGALGEGGRRRPGEAGHPHTDIAAADVLAVTRAADPSPAEHDPAAAALLGFQVGDLVSVARDDSGREPVSGRLVALTAHEVVLHRRVERLGELHAHFPRAGFDAQRAALTIRQ